MTQPSELVDFLETEAFTEEQIELSTVQMEHAARLSQSASSLSQQWQIYLHALARLGFKQWLEEWVPDLNVDDSRCLIDQPDRSAEICHLSVAKFDLCLIAAPFWLDSIDLPQAIVDLPQFVPHIYALVEVQEEQMQVRVCGYLRRDRLVEQQRSHSLSATPEGKYSVPLSWFNRDPTALLLELRCLEPYPLTLPQSQTVNVGQWLNDRLDDMARQLGWILMPPFAPAAALRSAQEELRMLSVQIPSEARGAYQELQVGTVSLRLHAVTWVLFAAIDAFEWTLLITLGGDRLPVGTRLRVRDDSQLLFEQAVEDSVDALFAQVGGGLTDRFWVTIDLPDQDSIDLPPFCFSAA